MARGPLHQSDYKPQFSGHETFPLRYGWLKKAYDAVARTEHNSENLSVFSDDAAIASFGVGKNMVTSMRHWAHVTGIIESVSGQKKLYTTSLGQKIFGTQGVDPYMESPATLWLLHWQLAGHPEKTTWFWVFSHFPNITFERDHLVTGLEKLAKDRNWGRVASATIKRDVECFVRTYATRPGSRQMAHEDALESPLVELGIIKPVGKRDGFRIVRGPKSSLGLGVFTYALLDFWRQYNEAQTLSFEALAHEPGSPGRVFQLDEDELANRLAELDEFTDGQLRWSETAGLKQVIRNIELDQSIALGFVDRDYEDHKKRRAA